MSYILDALKKVEQERKFDEVPGLDSRHDPLTQRPPRRWPWVLAVASLLSVSFIAGLWWRGGIPPSEGPIPTQRPSVPNPADAPDRVVTSPAVAPRLDSVPQRGNAAARVETDSADGPTAETTSPPTASARRPLRPLPLPDPFPSPESAPAKAQPREARESTLPEAAPVVPTGIVELRAPIPPAPSKAEPAWKNLPLWPLVPQEISRHVEGRVLLNVHFYSEDPDDRFVLVNMKKYTEGERLSEGPELEEITREGVILSVPGGRFRLRSD